MEQTDVDLNLPIFTQCGIDSEGEAGFRVVDQTNISTWKVVSAGPQHFADSEILHT